MKINSVTNVMWFDKCLKERSAIKCVSNVVSCVLWSKGLLFYGLFWVLTSAYIGNMN